LSPAFWLALDALDFFLVTFVLVPLGHDFGRTIPKVAFAITLTLMMRRLARSFLASSATNSAGAFRSWRHYLLFGDGVADCVSREFHNLPNIARAFWNRHGR